MPVLDLTLDDRSPLFKTFLISKTARRPRLQVKILDQSQPVSLTGATVTFSMDDENDVNKVNAAVGVLVDAANGIVGYDWGVTDTDTEGIFFGQFLITIAGTSYLVPNQSNQKLRIIVGPKIN